MSVPQERAPSEVREYLRVIRNRKWFVIIPLLVALAAAAVYSETATKMYTATIRMSVIGSAASCGSGKNNKTSCALGDDKTIIVQPAVLQPALDQLQKEGVSLTNNSGQGMTSIQLAKYVSPSVPASLLQTMVISVTYRKALDAALIANAVANSYVRYKTDQAAALIASQSQSLKAQLAVLKTSYDATVAQLQRPLSKGAANKYRKQLVTITTAMVPIQAQLSGINAANSPTITLLTAEGHGADVPKAPSSPNKIKNLLAAGAAGLVLGIALAFGAEALDDRIKSRAQFTQLTGAPAIGSIPMVKAWRKVEAVPLAVAIDPQGPVAEAYKALATNVMYMASQQPLQVLMVTSATAGEGKTTTAANLAVALSSLEQATIVVGLDLRAPAMHRVFGLSGDEGLSSILATPGVKDMTSRLRDAMQDVGIDHLRVIPGGLPAENATELIADFTSGGYLESLRGLAKFVVFDTPPILGVADASILAAVTDGVIFVGDAQNSKRSAISEARDQLESAGATLLGVVYNDISPKDSRYGTHYYSKYGKYQAYGAAKGTGVAKKRSRRKSSDASTFDMGTRPGPVASTPPPDVASGGAGAPEAPTGS
jgi:succinoglycan biosynthesis transport protein ExoP